MVEEVDDNEWLLSNIAMTVSLRIWRATSLLKQKLFPSIFLKARLIDVTRDIGEMIDAPIQWKQSLG
jgi:hypothetical protein